jgi:hypothetical protein
MNILYDKGKVQFDFIVRKEEYQNTINSLKRPIINTLLESLEKLFGGWRIKTSEKYEHGV